MTYWQESLHTCRKRWLCLMLFGGQPLVSPMHRSYPVTTMRDLCVQRKQQVR